MFSSRDKPLPLARIRHRLPWILLSKRLTLLKNLNRDIVGRTDERHVTVSGRTVDCYPSVYQTLARGVDIFDAVGEMTEVATTV